MAVCVAVACVWGRGFMPAASVVPTQHATPPGLVSGGPTLFSLPCHTLQPMLVMVSESPQGISLVFHAWGIPRQCLPVNFNPLCMAVDGCLSILLGVEVSLLSLKVAHCWCNGGTL